MSRPSSANGGNSRPSREDRIPGKGQERETSAHGEKASDLSPFERKAWAEIGAMTQRIKQDDPDGTSAARRSTGAQPCFPGEPPVSANDNDCEGSWLPVPFSGPLNSIASGQQEPTQRQSTEGARPSFPSEEVITPQAVQAGFRSSWKATLSRLAYVAAVSVAMFGWLYLLWLLVSSVQGIIS